MDIKKCLDLAKQSHKIGYLKIQDNDITLYDEQFLYRTRYNDPYVLVAHADVRNQAQQIITAVSNLPDSQVTEDLIYTIDLLNIHTTISLINAIKDLINTIGQSAQLDVNQVLQELEDKRQQFIPADERQRSELDGSNYSLKTEDVLKEFSIPTTEDELTQRENQQKQSTKPGSVYAGYPALRKPNPSRQRRSNLFRRVEERAKIKQQYQFKNEDEESIFNFYDIALEFQAYQNEVANDILNRTDLFLQTTLTGESCCLVKYILFWYFTSRDFNGQRTVKIDQKTQLPDFQYHRDRFMKTVNAELARFETQYDRVLTILKNAVDDFYKRFYEPAVINGSRSLDAFFDLTQNISDMMQFFGNVMSTFKNPSSIGSQILGVLEGIVQSVLAQQVQSLIQIAIAAQDQIKQQLINALASSLKERLFYFSVLKSNFLYYYGNENVKVKRIHDVFDSRYLPDVSGGATGWVNCRTIVNFTSQFLDVMSGSVIINIVDDLLSVLIVILFKFIYRLLEEQFTNLQFLNLFKNLQFRRRFQYESQQKQLWSTVQNVVNTLTSVQSMDMLKACVLNRDKQIETQAESYLFQRISQMFDVPALRQLLKQMSEIPFLKELAENINKLLDFLSRV